jgi:diaminohydroxyphosphoribosylaminopyrimidine deaminase/5-amino-6-(5-phosphoribosylamino)uracil reductase
MKKALALAEKGLGLSSPNPSVGCVIVQDGKILGRGWHEYALMDHAEVGALRESGERSRGATAYVTLEPCCHQGRTPPCVHRLIEARVRRVVVARIDPNPRVAGRGIELLRSAGIQVDVGLMEEDAGRIIEPFACRMTAGRPFIVSKAGMSLDGKIGTAGRSDRWITSPESRNFGQTLRLGVDAILVGAGTVLSDDPELTYRGKAPKARPLTRVVLDSGLRMPPAARLLLSSPGAPVLVFCGAEAARTRSAELESRGAEVIPVPAFNNEVDLLAVLEELSKREILGILVEGGSEVHWSFLSSRLVDKFYFIIAPLVLGGRDAVPAVGGAGYQVIAESPRFRVRRSFYSGPDLVLEAYPSYSRSIISPWLPREIVPSAKQDLLQSSGRK